MSAELILRVIFLFLFGIAGWISGNQLGSYDKAHAIYYITGLTAGGGLLGALAAPYLTTRPAHALRALVARISVGTLLAGIAGLVTGLIAAALTAYPLSLLPQPLGGVLPLVAAIIFAWIGMSLFVMRHADIASILAGRIGRRGAEGAAGGENVNRTVLLDTSVIIDGRVADIARAGFLPGTLLIPRFVLNELQYIADSPDGLRRQRGRRGMEILADLQKMPNVQVRISDIDVNGVREVDDKLVVLGKQLKSPVLTNDYNLNRVAEIQGVTVLNINELANAVKSVVLPGEALNINVFQEGKESGQGVGYMDDGTMVVVENGRDYIGEYIDVQVTKVLQTAAGRMIFGRVEETNGRAKARRNGGTGR